MKNRSETLLAILPALACFMILSAPKAFGVTPPPDGCFPNFTTAEGCEALNSLTTGSGNTGLGWRALFTNSSGNFNTGVGAGALVLNNADSNTAVGTAALLLNTAGTENTAVGATALVFNDSGNSNTATGFAALTNNTTGGANTAIGWSALTANTIGVNNVAVGTLPLSSNTIGNDNTAIGDLALRNSVNSSNNVCVGRLAGFGITGVDNNIIIGHHTGVHSTFDQESDVCYIDNIWGKKVDNSNPIGPALLVFVDPDGRLGTAPVGAGESPGRSSGIQSHAVRDGEQAMLKIQKLRATVTQQQQQIDALIAQLNDNTAQIQKANTQLEMNGPEPKVVSNKSKTLR